VIPKEILNGLHNIRGYSDLLLTDLRKVYF